MLKAGDEEIETTQLDKEKSAAQQMGTEQEPRQPTPPPSLRAVSTGQHYQEKVAPSAQAKPFSRMQAKIKVIPEGRNGQLNTRYLATLPGVLKIAEVLLGFVSFILAICADRRSTSSAWTEHITFETTIVVCLLIMLYVVFPHLSLSDTRTREGLVVVELLFYGLNTLFFFIGIWLMVHLAASWTAEGRGAAIMNAITCLALCVIYAVETYIKFTAWNKQEATVPRAQSPYQVPPAPIHQRHLSSEKRFEGGEEV